VVFLLDAGGDRSGAARSSDTDNPRVVVERGNRGPLIVNPLRLAVTPPEYDDMGKMLDTLGAGYRYTNIEMDDLLEAERLGRYDVVFLTCGGVPREWLGRRVRDGQRDGDAVYQARREVLRRLKESLRSYVGDGGTLYVSDWQFSLLQIAFPEFVDREKAASGAIQTVEAEVVDPGLQRRLGPSVKLRFDKPSWRPAAFKESKVATLLRGSYQTVSGRQATGPLLVKFPYGEGNVIFTSFHNEKQNSEIELQLLRCLVFATVTAELDSKVKRTMVRGGFSPVDRNLLSASPKDQSITQTYQCEGGRSLKFVLGFQQRGARLRLTVIGPDGSRQQDSGTSTFTIDVARAAAGQWKYTVTPLSVPYENFPFTLTVGEKQ